jgi:hypothetical protein
MWKDYNINKYVENNWFSNLIWQNNIDNTRNSNMARSHIWNQLVDIIMPQNIEAIAKQNTFI